ncbi:hypothetical protein Golob_015263 [Gossypium lobatum]|uniref:DUF4283 domain-containing protein n=1 Tax=Gossypium lobatum TaxID=34289 RepID=A0A7J8M0K8_9ROSI|nr:hypothetical protein [Gossypium lobatum]
MEFEEQDKTEDGQSDSRQPKGGVANNQEGGADVVMEAVLVLDRHRSWKDRLMGIGLQIDDKTKTSTKEKDDDDLDLLDEDIMRTSLNNIPTIEFSNRVTQLLIEDMEHMVPYPNMVMAWIRLPRLPGKILWEIGGMIGRVAELDFNTNNGVRGRFARMAVYINLGKALISLVLINGVLQRIEYEYLPTINNGVAREKKQENIRFQPLETLNDEMGSHESRPAKETNLTQKEAGYAVTPPNPKPSPEQGYEALLDLSDN